MTTLDGRRVAYQDAWARANAVGSGGTERAGITWASAEPVRRTDALAAIPIAGSTTSS